ncbi:bifunctional UDP-sugar hydrolase/5'-nucleotidase, partial [Paracoccus sp. (in: a-proteobacteria)]|uniref:bifunctional metallophosphatase/5'-nucleotidase n=1 Tax=Paracoccus sp. TaxID=267 RepID=UPI0026DF5A92
MTRLLLTTALVALGTTAQADYVLHILHTNDLHSRIEPINAFDSTCDAETLAKDECFGGVARLKAAIDARREAIRAGGGNVIVLDAGDQYQGSLFYTTYKGRDTVEFMNAIGYDAMALGNHEFDDGPEGAAVLLDGAAFPVMSGNLDVSQSNQLAGKLRHVVTLEVGGEKIGLVSALAMDTPETASPGPLVIFHDDMESLKAGVQALEADGVDKIIALTHVGYGRDLAFAAEVPGLDAIIGGHSHTLLGDMEGAAGPYPTRATGPEGAEVPVATAYAYGKYLGELKLIFDDEGRLTAAEGAPILLDASVPEDPAIAARVAELAKPLEELRQKQVAEIAVPLGADRADCRARECVMGNVVADAMLARVADQGVSIAIQNGGGLRASIDAGPVTMGEVYDVLPFQNSLSTFRAKGSTVLAALENGASEIE